MTGATHMLTAAASYSILKTDISIALPIAFGSHFIFDSIPHHEPNLKYNYLLGFLAGIYLFTLAFISKDLFLLIAAFLGAFPDLNWMFGISKSLEQFHNFIHIKKVTVNSKYLIVSEFVIAIISIILINIY